LKWTTFWRWLIQGFWHSICCIFIPFILYNCFTPYSTTEYYYDSVDDNGNITYYQKQGLSWNLKKIFKSDGAMHIQDNSLFFLGTIVFTSAVFIVTIKVCYIENHNHTIFTHLAAFLSLLFWFGWNFIYYKFSYLIGFGENVHELWYNVFSSPAMIIQASLLVLLTVVCALVICDYAFAVIWSWFNLDKNHGNEIIEFYFG